MKSSFCGGVLALAVALLAPQIVRAQAFTNLNFESASLVPVPGDPYNRVQFAQAFPGWTGTVGGVQQTLALYNSVFLDSAGISIIDQNSSPSFIPANLGVIQGNYTTILMSGLTLASNPQPADTTLSQTALVPFGTQSLLFKANLEYANSSDFIVTLGGQTLSLTALSTDSNYTLYGANVSSWAGQTAQLAFTVLAEIPHGGDEYVSLDAIQFSTQSIPEPGVLGLFGLGGLAFLWRRRKSADVQ